MGFRNPLTALSELVADKIVGAILKTAETGSRIEIRPVPLGGQIVFYVDGFDFPGIMQASGAGATATLQIQPPTNDLTPPVLQLISESAGTGRLTANNLEKVDLRSAGTDLSAVDLTGDSLQVGSLSNPLLRGLDWGLFVGNTDGTGGVQVAHELDAVPSAVICSEANGSSPWVPWVKTAGLTTTTFDVQMRRADTNAVAGAGQAVSFFWLAVT